MSVICARLLTYKLTLMHKTDDFISQKLRDLKQSIAHKQHDLPRSKSNLLSSQYNQLPVNIIEENEHKVRRISQEPHRLAPTIIEEETHTKVRTEYARNGITLNGNKIADFEISEPAHLTVPKASINPQTPIFASHVYEKQGGASPINDHIQNTAPRVIRVQRAQDPGLDYKGMKSSKQEYRTIYQTADFNPSSTVHIERANYRPQSATDDRIFNNLMKTTILERYKTNMTGDLNARLEDTQSANHRLAGEITQLKTALQSEQTKTVDAERTCREDLADVQARQREVQKLLEETQRALQDKEHGIKQRDEASYKVS